MNLQEQTIQQKQAAVALRPELDKRYRHLMTLLEESCNSEIDLWKLDLARADLCAVLDVMLPRIVEPGEYE